MVASPNMKNGKSFQSRKMSKISGKHSESTMNRTGEENKETSWKSIYLVTAICMFCGVQFSIYFPTLWPFLKTVDPTTSEMFFGIITASFSLGQGMASPIFGFWMNRSKSIRQPLIYGITIMIVANVIFCFVEAFKQEERRWVMMVSRFFVGLGAGTVSVMRAYAATGSSLKDRLRAITLVQAAYVIGMTIGPAMPVVFSPINYPGWVFGPLHVDMYTSSAWFACLVCIVSLILLLILLEEKYAGVQDEEEADYNPLPKFDVLPVSICVLTQFTLMFIITNLETYVRLNLATLIVIIMLTILITGIIQALNGIFSIFIYASFVLKFGDCMSKGRERICTMFGLGLALLYHIATFPFPFGPTLKLTTKVLPHNVTLKLGCDPREYAWCSSTHYVTFWLYGVLYCTLLAAAFPFVTVSMNTLFSKILGPRRQGTMQGIMLMAGSLARVIGPLVVSSLFQLHGPVPVWSIEIGTLSITLLLWSLFYRRLVPLKIPDLSSGEYMKYPNGIKYRL
ncbi:unnamed protein product [Angiostrongylus costaricensis]|uniref:MFS domain-containing protein n=1 Tax=Angiostrongylus costaricensis TaxID=334426 RepID=A0A158PFB4_ANGCS|nr:unnamed protein product [Angiostrongylus costaricensis]